MLIVVLYGSPVSALARLPERALRGLAPFRKANGQGHGQQARGHRAGPAALARRLTQSSQSTDLRTYQPLSSRVGMYSAVQSSPVAPTTLFDCAT